MPWSESDVIRKGGLRFIKPYRHTFKCYAKGRWLGKSISEVYKTHFTDEKRDMDYFRTLMENGSIKINDQSAKPDQIVKPHDLIECSLDGVEEPPVLDQDPEILHRDEHTIIIHKPASMPVHSSGRYRKNTLAAILRQSEEISYTAFLYRLDAPVSGTMVIALDSATFKVLKRRADENRVRKEYLALVHGEFPDKPIHCRKAIKMVREERSAFAITTHDNDPDGKPCQTYFRRLYTNGAVSLVHCELGSGRTHQIRVHLKSQGFPIVDDLFYNNAYTWPPCRVSFEHADAGMVTSIAKRHRSFRMLCQRLDRHSIRDGLLAVRKAHDLLFPTERPFDMDLTSQELCETMSTFEMGDSSIDTLRLHCFRYSMENDWSYSCLPSWLEHSFPDRLVLESIKSRLTSLADEKEAIYCVGNTGNP